MLTIAFSSSTALVAVAVAENGDILARSEAHTDRRHAEEITPMLQSVLAGAGVGLAELDRVVVDIGPGRYTGMRVGIATATTLAHVLGIPVSTITSLELLRRAAIDRGIEPPIVPVVDARRNEVFAAIGDRLLVVRHADLIEQLPADCTLVGDGADRYRDDFTVQAKVCSGVVPSIAAAAALPSSWPTLDPVTVEPLYVREPDAAINIRVRPGGKPAP